MIRDSRALLRLACLLAAAVAVGLLLAGCKQKEAAGAAGASKPPAVPVDASVATTDTIQRTVEVVGTLFGEEDATISNKVNGKVIAIYKDIGDRADPGEPLAQLLRNDYLLSVNQKRAAVLETLGKLGVEDVPTEKFDISTLPAVRKAKLQANNAQAKYDRGVKLYAVEGSGEKIVRKENPLISDQDFEDLRTAWDVAKSSYDVELATARGLIGEARTRLAELRIAEQALADTTIRAPYEKYEGPSTDMSARPSTQPVEDPAPASPTAGKSNVNAAGQLKRYVIAGRMASVGELLTAVSPMFKLVDDDPLKLKAAVPERYFSELKIGQEVQVSIDAAPKPVTGTVSRINPQVDVANRTFAIEVLIDNKDHTLPTGVFARGSIKTREEKVVFIPATAVVSFAGNDKVFLIASGKVTERQVKLGERREGPGRLDLIEVIEGLNGGEQIATSGTSRLANGVAVEIKTAAPATRPATGPTTTPRK